MEKFVRGVYSILFPLAPLIFCAKYVHIFCAEVRASTQECLAFHRYPV